MVDVAGAASPESGPVARHGVVDDIAIHAVQRVKIQLGGERARPTKDEVSVAYGLGIAPVEEEARSREEEVVDAILIDVRRSADN